MAIMNVEEKVFQLPIQVTENGIITKTLATADTYVDKNIKITVTTPDATYEVKQAGAVTATVSNKDTTYTQDTETPYAVTIAADANAAAVTVGVKDAGFAAATDTVEVAAASAEQAIKTIYIKEGHLDGSGEASASSESVQMTQVASDAEGFIIKASAAGGAKVDVAGWLPAGAQADASGDAYYAVQKASFANTGSADAEELTAPVLTEGGYLFIKEGYVKDSKISLATLVPDNAVLPGVVDGQSDLMYNTIVALDNDGNRVAGTMGDAALTAITANDAAATISAVEVTADGSAFKVTGAADISGTTSVGVATRGLATTALTQSGVISGEAKVEATLAKVGVTVNATTADIEVIPVISKEDATTAKTGAITTVQPTGRYVAVSTAAIEASTTVNPTVTTAGYGTADAFNATSAEVTGGAAASGVYYIPVNAGGHSVEAADPTIVNATATVATEAAASAGFQGDLTAGIRTTVPSGEYITITADANAVKGSVSGVVTCTATEGYIEAGQETASIAGDVQVEITAAAAKYIRVYGGEII